MKTFFVAIGCAVFLAVLFIGGVLANAVVPAMAGFCLWTPAMVFLGYSFRGIGKRLALVDTQEQAQPAKRITPLQNGRTRLARPEETL